ncbi:MAG: iron complex outermembrane receptor protein [Roseivirga sp.]|jgi:iron complex outermembrane receptor protein
MMNMKRILKGWILAFLIMQTITLYGQSQVSISGRVVDAATGETLPGVNIRVKDRVIGTITTAKGDFSLKVTQDLPVELIFSYVGYKPQTLTINESSITGLEIKMEEEVLFGQDVVVSASRVQESILRSPVSIEKMDILDIQNTAAVSFYEGLATLKGVDFSTQSLTFKSINTRGFGANGNTRFVQLIDGIDNQAPGLNFAVGNIVGINDLDLESAEMIPGAASALYGPNAINGILLLTSKNPFDYQGLSVYAKTGINHVDGRDDDVSLYQDYGFRYAKAYNNKIAFKVTASYLQASDFRGVDTRDQGLATGGVVERGATERGDNRFYDGVNTYGDFGITVGAIADGAIAGGNTALIPIRTLFPDNIADGLFTPTGFSEGSFVDNTTESIKMGGALHYRINDKLEIFGQVNYGSGSTVYTANDRFVLDNFSITTGKIELKGSNFYVRGYTTQENSGDSYAANTLASLINQQTYLAPYLQTFAGARLSGASIDQSHDAARVAADAAQPQPGSEAFNTLAQRIRSTPISEGGALFLDKSSLYHAEGSWDLSNKIDFADIVIGGNVRSYSLESGGTLFALENNGDEVSYSEFGTYLQASKSLANDNLKIQASVRYDKNEYFKGQLSPRISAVGTLSDNHNFRGSFQRGFRIPTTQDQFIDLDVVTRRLIGSNDLLVDRYNFETNTVFTTQSVAAARAAGDPSLLAIETRVSNEFKTEKVNTFEVGYKGLFASGRLLVDAYYYYSVYNDFIAEIDFTQAIPDGLRNDNPQANTGAQRNDIVSGAVRTQRYGFDVNADGNVLSQGWALQLDYQLGDGFEIGGNVAYNELISQADLLAQGFQASYNTPKYRYNLKFANRKLTEKLGFNVTYRWQQAFLWESAFGTGVIPEFGTLDAQVSYRIPQWKSIIKLGASNLFNERYTTSFGNPELGAIYYVQITFDEFFN